MGDGIAQLVRLYNGGHAYSPFESFPLVCSVPSFGYRDTIDLPIKIPLNTSLSTFYSTSVTLSPCHKWQKVKNFVSKGGFKHLVRPSVRLHGTAFPKTQAEQEKLGIRFDFAGTIEEGGKKFHRFQVQVNAGNKIPSSWKQWRQNNPRGTHGIVATIKVPDNGTKDDVQAALDAVDDEID